MRSARPPCSAASAGESGRDLGLSTAVAGLVTAAGPRAVAGRGGLRWYTLPFKPVWAGTSSALAAESLSPTHPPRSEDQSTRAATAHRRRRNRGSLGDWLFVTVRSTLRILPKKEVVRRRRLMGMNTVPRFRTAENSLRNRGQQALWQIRHRIAVPEVRL